MEDFNIKIIYASEFHNRYTTYAKIEATDLEQACIDATNLVRTYPKCKTVIHAGPARGDGIIKRGKPTQ